MLELSCTGDGEIQVKKRKRADEHSKRAQSPVCEKCKKRPAIKTNSESQWECRRCADGVVDPIKRTETQHRNQKCQCGSGKKFKNCCLITPKEPK
jgi:ribosomal protein L37AE/L43A